MTSQIQVFNFKGEDVRVVNQDGQVWFVAKDIGDLAKLLRQNGVDIGQNRLFERLRNAGFLMKQGSSKNMPTQLSMEMGLFRIKETVINKSDGSVLITRTPKITSKGQIYFINYFLGDKEAA